MLRFIKLLSSLFLLFLLQILFSSCLWDSDTIEMEREKFPSVLELISGNFLRHSPAFYHWRIKDRASKLQTDSTNKDWYDDLAVAYSKLGKQKEAIQLMERKEQLFPNEYKTYANLGTFYIFAGELDTALQYINKALEIDANAHFGREVYQKYLVEYLLKKSSNKKLRLPLNQRFVDIPQDYYFEINKHNFYAFLLRQKPYSKYEELPEEALEKAIIGVLGMMRFANHDSPILLEVLGDLLLGTGHRSAARNLAARAYLKAAQSVEDPKSKELYIKRVVLIIDTQYANEKKERLDLVRLKELLKEEIVTGDNFYQQIKADELNWIEQGINVDEAFSKKYYQSPQIAPREQKGGNLKDLRGMRSYVHEKLPKSAKIDYRPVLKSEWEWDDKTATQVDSLFERSLIVEVKQDSSLNRTVAQKKASETNTYYIYFTIGLILLLGIIFIQRYR